MQTADGRCQFKEQSVLFIAFYILKLHPSVTLYSNGNLMLILDGGLGLIKVSFKKIFLHINLFKNLRTPIHDHERKEPGMVRRAGLYSRHNYTARHLYRMYMCNNVIYIDFFIHVSCIINTQSWKSYVAFNQFALSKKRGAS